MSTEITIFIDCVKINTIKYPNNKPIDTLFTQLDKNNIIVINNGNFITNFTNTLIELNIVEDTSIYIYNIKKPIINYTNFLTNILSNNYTTQLTQLNELGFTDNNYNNFLLSLYTGNIDLVVEILINN